MGFQHFDDIEMPSRESIERWKRDKIEHDRKVILGFLDLLSENGEEIGEVDRFTRFEYEYDEEGIEETEFNEISPSKLQSLINQFLEAPKKRKPHTK
jgi:hypothetical protein